MSPLDGKQHGRQEQKVPILQESRTCACVEGQSTWMDVKAWKYNTVSQEGQIAILFDPRCEASARSESCG